MFSLYDVTIIDNDFNYRFIQVLAMSEVDARHICEIKGYYVKAVAKSIE